MSQNPSAQKKAQSAKSPDKAHKPAKEIKLEQLRDMTQKRLIEVVDSHSFHPDLERKSRDERIADNLKWYSETGYVNSCYNEYGLDIKDFRDQEAYIERWLVKKDRNSLHHGGIDPARHKSMILDKISFYAYLEKMLPGYTPKVRVIFSGGGTSSGALYYPLLAHETPEEAITALPVGRYACKLSRGTMGADFFLFERIENGFKMGGQEVEVADIIARTTPWKRYLIQDFVYQHKEFAKMAPSSLNTVRVETVRWGKETHIHYALARFSAREGVNVDNATQGGTFVGVDTEHGTLKEYGEYFKFENGAHQKAHPISGITYLGFEIPFWEEIQALVKMLHPLFYGLPSIGWDIAITEAGPVVLEGNSSPCSKMAQMANGGLRERWDSWKNL